MSDQFKITQEQWDNMLWAIAQSADPPVAIWCAPFVRQKVQELNKGRLAIHLDNFCPLDKVYIVGQWTHDQMLEQQQEYLEARQPGRVA